MTFTGRFKLTRFRVGSRNVGEEEGDWLENVYESLKES